MSATATELERFTEAVGGFAEWASVDDIVSACDAEGFFDDAFLAASEANAKKLLVRRLMRRVKDDTGFPVWASIKTKDDEGNTVQRYKQETLFNVDDYRQVVGFHSQQSEHHREMAKTYITRCKTRFGKQLKFDL